jgi:hypothetical protein
MKARIKRYHSPDALDLQTYRPTESNCFALLLQVMIAPEGSEGEESFDLVVCTPKYLESKLDRQGVPMFGKQLLIVKSYDFAAIQRLLEDYCGALEGSDWPELANKLSRIARWEFEDYRNSVGKEGVSQENE